ncbi:hypothetical protein [Isoptericola sp. NPDC056134]|uniref:hypothetical protein n=1 Tax=Isoptericola sp. NPDC056134 TaxID=3345723 RepID=UPI0035E5E33C
MPKPHEITTTAVVLAITFAVLSHWLPEGTTLVDLGIAVALAIHPGKRPPSSPAAPGSSVSRVWG